MQLPISQASSPAGSRTISVRKTSPQHPLRLRANALPSRLRLCSRHSTLIPLPSSRMSLDTEALLIARCRRGDAKAWDELFTAHYAATGRFVFQLAPDFSHEDVEEICQEAFLAVIHNIKTFEGNSHLQTWIFRIAANKARDYRQRQQAAKRGGGIAPISLQAENPETGLVIDPPSSALTPDDSLITAERATQVGEALEILGGPCQEIIELRYFADLSYEEISTALKLNPKTVSSRLSKCMDRLEEIMQVVICGKKPKPSSV